MLGRILPQTIDNAYRGHELAIWLLIAILILKAATGLTSLFAGRVVALGAHRVPIGGFPPNAARLLVLVLARLALATLLLTLFGVLVLIRYRAMIPVTYILLLLQHMGGEILLLKESKITGMSSATVVNTLLLFLSIVGLIASLYGGSDGA